MSDHLDPKVGATRMWLSDASIKYPSLVAMFVVLTCLVGVISYGRLPLNLFPNFDIPVVSVRVIYPGASPEEVERAVTKPVEDAVASISGVDTIQSTSSDSLAILTVTFHEGRSGKDAVADVSQKLTTIRGDLPADALDPVATRFDFTTTPLMSVAFADRGGRTPEELRTLVDDTFRGDLEDVDGVAAVTVSGGRTREVHIDLMLDRLRALGVSAQSIVAAVKGENSNVPAGRLNDKGSESLVRTSGEFKSLADIGDIVLTGAGGSQVRLRDVAQIGDGAGEARQISRLNGYESATLTIQKQTNANTVTVARQLRAETERIQAAHPELAIAIAYDASIFAESSVSDVQTSLILGAILASLVVFAFFRDARNTFVTVAGLPVVLLGTFAVMGVLGIGLNFISTLALSLCVGLLVDDAIVVRENIFRHIERGENAKRAAQVGTAEIALAVVAVTSTIVAVFLPIGFIGGQVGVFLRDFGVTVSVAMILSLIESFTLAPMLSAHLFSRPRAEGSMRAPSRLSRLPLPRIPKFSDRGYRRLLGFSLDHRPLIAGIGLGLFVLSLALATRLPFAFQPTADQGEFWVNIELPAGTRLEETDRVGLAMDDILRADPQVDRVVAAIGTADGGIERGSLDVKLRTIGVTRQTIERLRPALEDAARPLGHVTIALEPSDGQPEGVRGRPILVSLKGDNPVELESAAAVLADRIAAIPGAADVDRSVRPGKPGIDIVVDRARAADLGVPASQVGATIRTLLSGTAATTFRSGEHSYDVVVRLRPEDRTDTNALLRLPVTTSRGTQVALSSVARVNSVQEPTQIDRTDREREVLVGAAARGRDQSAVAADITAVMDDLRASTPDVTMEFSGALQQQNEAFVSLFIALGLSILAVYVILAIQFTNVIHPLTIMLALPFSIVGALMGLLVTQKTMDILAMIGIILLMGIVTKNSILLVDFANRRMRAGATARAAMLEAGPTRLRPILMTTAAMILGMLPAALGAGAGSEFRQGMGIAVIGGLITSTLLTLVIVPVVYTWLDSVTHSLGRRFARTAHHDEPVAIAAAPAEGTE